MTHPPAITASAIDNPETAGLGLLTFGVLLEQGVCRRDDEDHGQLLSGPV